MGRKSWVDAACPPVIASAAKWIKWVLGTRCWDASPISVLLFLQSMQPASWVSSTSQGACCEGFFESQTNALISSDKQILQR